MCDLDAGIRGHESRVDRERVAALSRSTSVPQLLHGVFGGRAHAGPPHQEGPQSAFKNGGQLSQVKSPRTLVSNYGLKHFHPIERLNPSRLDHI